jgi:hypothetical protein
VITISDEEDLRQVERGNLRPCARDVDERLDGLRFIEVKANHGVFFTASPSYHIRICQDLARGVSQRGRWPALRFPEYQLSVAKPLPSRKRFPCLVGSPLNAWPGGRQSEITHGPAARRVPLTCSENQRTGGVRDGGGTGLRAGTLAGDGGGVGVLSIAPCWIASSLVISAASLSMLCRTTARPRDTAAS